MPEPREAFLGCPPQPHPGSSHSRGEELEDQGIWGALKAVHISYIPYLL